MLVRDLIKEIEEEVFKVYPDGKIGITYCDMFSTLRKIGDIASKVVASHGIDTSGYIDDSTDAQTREICIPFRLSDGTSKRGLWLKSSFKKKERYQKAYTFRGFDLSQTYLEDKLDMTLEEVLSNLEKQRKAELDYKAKKEDEEQKALQGFLDKYHLSCSELVVMVNELAKLDIVNITYRASDKIKKLSEKKE